MLNEEEVIGNYIKTSLFTLFMLAIGAFLDPNWAIIVLLSLIYLKEKEQ